MENCIEIKQLSKQYKNSTDYSLKQVSFTVQKRDKFGIFGPNGAGKTTLISIMTGVLEASQGDVNYLVNGKKELLKNRLYNIGYVPQDFSFFEELTPTQNLKYFGALYNIPSPSLKEKIRDLLSVLGLSHVAHKKANTFSGGMKRRLNLAIAIINDPEVLFLDEPTVGVDVQSKNAIMAYLEQLNKQGTTIIYTSHHMNEAQDFCNTILLLDEGQKIACAPIRDLLTEHQEDRLENLFLKLTGTAYRD